MSLYRDEARRSQEEPRVANMNKEEPGGARRKPGGNQEEPG
jgi:hypothetical protein